MTENLVQRCCPVSGISPGSSSASWVLPIPPQNSRQPLQSLLLLPLLGAVTIPLPQPPLQAPFGWENEDKRPLNPSLWTSVFRLQTSHRALTAQLSGSCHFLWQACTSQFYWSTPAPSLQRSPRRPLLPGAFLILSHHTWSALLHPYWVTAAGEGVRLRFHTILCRCVLSESHLLGSVSEIPYVAVSVCSESHPLGSVSELLYVAESVVHCICFPLCILCSQREGVHFI